MNITYKEKKIIILAIILVTISTSGAQSVLWPETLYCGLYQGSDPVVILTANNFNDTVLGTENAWIIQFYSSENCDACKSFEFIWRNFYYYIKDWSHTIKVGVINCFYSSNFALCRKYVNSPYPVINFFGANTRWTDRGTIIPRADSKTMKNSVIDFLAAKQVKNSGSHTWVNLLPYECNNIENILKDAQPEAEFGVLIVERNDTFIARRSILDLGGIKTIYVRKIYADSKALDNIDLPSIPSVVIIDKNGKYKVLEGEPNTRKKVTELIKKEFDIKVNKEDKEPTNSSRISSPGTQNREAPIYIVDIENALFHSLMVEVPRKNISGEYYNALINYIDILIRYLPTRPRVLNFLRNFHNYLKENTHISGEELVLAIKKLQSPTSALPEMKQWKGCLGSRPDYRGYRCGLWVTFHALTVNAVLREKNNPNYNPIDVMRGIHGYIKYFFVYRICSEHFKQTYAKDAEYVVKKPNDEIMWFWKTHNIVNMRIKCHSTEDPEHPKQLFPTKMNCPECYQTQGNSFHKENVVKYLKKLYDDCNISYEEGQPSSGNNEIKVSLKFGALLTCSLYFFISKFVIVSL